MNDSPDDALAPAGGERPADGAFAGAQADARPIKPLPGPAPAPAAATTAQRAPRRGFRRFLAWWLVFGLVATVALAICVAVGLNLTDTPIHIVIDGDDVTAGLSTGGMDFMTAAWVGVGLFAAAMLAMLIVPLIALVVVGAVAFALMAGLGTPILVLALVLAVLTSPAWLVGLLVWFFARRRQAHSATMAA